LTPVNSGLAPVTIWVVMREKRYTTNGLARAAGCTRKALRVYQAHGLMNRPEKTWQACFDDTAVDRLKLIMTLRQAGLSIAEIGALLRTRDDRLGGAADTLPLAAAVRDVVQGLNKRITELQGIRDQLAGAHEILLECMKCEHTVDKCGPCADERGYDPLTRALLVARATG
jgi:DNA-binding transcriptional MerR regulator